MTNAPVLYSPATDESDSGGIAKITLNRPDKLNALTLEMLDSLESAIGSIDRDPNCRVVVVTGAGEKAFCAGADITAWSGFTPLQMWRQWIRRGHQVFDRLAGLQQPSIAVLNGIAFGGGLELALACDLRISTTNARLALPEATLGTIPGWAGSQRLPKIIGIARAKQMVFTGEPIDAQTAENWGLVNEITAAEGLAARSDQLAQRIAQNAPIAVQTAKQLLDCGVGVGVGASIEALASAVNAATQDNAEGLDAFRSRRKPTFKGE